MTNPTNPALPTPSARLREVDILRGLVIVLMALDHIRDFFHISGYAINALDPNQSHPLLYATRWITHFCAPTFVFLAGVSAWLQFAKGKSRPQLSVFLLTRGLWLIVLEVTLISFGWSFSFPYPLLVQVIWAIGAAMIALAALIWLPRLAVLALGVAIILGHNLLDPIQANGDLLWTLTHQPGPLIVGGTPIGYVAYPALPWIGICAFGYGMGALILQPPEKRDRVLIGLGLAMVVAFFLLRGLNLYGEPSPWNARESVEDTIMAFMNVTKYPPSLMYTLITLGPMFLVLPLLAKLRGVPAHVLGVFGAVPFFFYVLHIYLVHALGIAANAAAGNDVSGMFGFMMNVFTAQEKLAGLGLPLGYAYLGWLVALAILYPLCRWWAGVKSRRRDWWLSYL